LTSFRCRFLYTIYCVLCQYPHCRLSVYMSSLCRERHTLHLNVRSFRASSTCVCKYYGLFHRVRNVLYPLLDHARNTASQEYEQCFCESAICMWMSIRTVKTCGVCEVYNRSNPVRTKPSIDLKGKQEC
jgi:hypothetical protein